ncbi:hypothetical protein GCM10027280_39110 [Micromonospora polyrhachis]|uniref:DivIVA domain-containing protein n=1 Tax=Micromonospora polyrhachis TaxID=1282883 RepID=A0A7W7SS22_9ACTN|nr:DivIVA domain-containing protein [Micromonospora polyrhachis]
MDQLLLLLVVALTVAAVVFGVTVLVTGGDSGLVPAEPDGRAVPLPGGRPLVEDDVSDVRFDTTFRGYRMAQVDQALRRAAYDIGYKDELIGVLEAEVIALREGRTADADVLRQAREAALAPAGAATRQPSEPARSADQPSESTRSADQPAVLGPAEDGPRDVPPATGGLPTIGRLPQMGRQPESAAGGQTVGDSATAEDSAAVEVAQDRQRTQEREGAEPQDVARQPETKQQPATGPVERADGSVAEPDPTATRSERA